MDIIADDGGDGGVVGETNIHEERQTFAAGNESVARIVGCAGSQALDGEEGGHLINQIVGSSGETGAWPESHLPAGNVGDDGSLVNVESEIPDHDHVVGGKTGGIEPLLIGA